MRLPNLSKKTLFAAAVFAGCVSLAQAELYNGSNRFQDYQNNTIILDPSLGTTPSIEDLFLGDGANWGTLIKDSGVPTEIRGNSDFIYNLHTNFQTPYATHIIDHGTGDEFINSGPVSFLTGANSWSAGELIINSGRLQVVGCINMWADYGNAYNNLALQGSPNGEMTGVDLITIYNGGTLDIGKSLYTTMSRSMVGGDSAYKFIALNNLRAGTLGDQSQAELYTGDKGSFHVALNVEASDGTNATTRSLAQFIADPNGGRDGGSVGIINGSANIYKTGAGKLTILSDATITGSVNSGSSAGSVFAAGGTLLLRGSAARELTNSEDPKGVLAKNGYDYDYGHALWTAASVNIAGTIDSQSLTGSATTSLSEASRQGVDVRSTTISTTYDALAAQTITQIKENYFARPEAGALVITQNQIIKNLQALFANGASATDATLSSASAIQNAADITRKDSPIITGTGIGSYIGVGEGDTLAIYQEAGKGGIYKGTICGVKKYDPAGNEITSGEAYTAEIDAKSRGGSIVKYGAGDLALILEGANYSSLAVLEGTLVSNIAGINLDAGSYDWAKDEWIVDPGLFVAEGATFAIVENNASTLKTRLEVDGSLIFSTYYLINTLGGSVDVSNNFRAPGTIEIAEEQRFVTGNVYVQGGIEIILTASGLYSKDNNVDADGNEIVFSDGTFGLANSVIVWGDERTSKLSFNNSNQKVNNLTGNSLGEILLGTGTLTANITSNAAVLVGTENYTYGTFNGKISGTGNILKTGAGTLTLGGGSSVSYSGVMGVAEGKLVATTASSLQVASSLILNKGTSATFTGSQSLTSLFGFAESSVTVTDAGSTLTIGETSSRTSILNQATSSLMLTNVLGNASGATDTVANGMTDSEFETYFEKPIMALLGKDLDAKDSTGTLVMTNGQMTALQKYFTPNHGTFSVADAKHLNYLFGREVFNPTTGTLLSAVTRADITHMYATFLAKTTFGAETGEKIEINLNEFVSGKLVDTAQQTALDRLAYDGSLSVVNLDKIGSTRVTVSGKLSASSVKVSAGTLELDWDSLLATATTGTTISGNVANGITVAEGATFAFNTDDATNDITLNESISGKGNFEKQGDGKLILGSNVIYSGETLVYGGELQMTLRAVPVAGDSTATLAQTSVSVLNAASTLILNQSTDVVWGGILANQGNLEKIGAGALTLSGGRTTPGSVAIAGKITVTEGSLTILDYAPLGDIAVVEETTFGFDTNVNLTFANSLSGAGTIAKSGTGMLTLNGTSNTDFTGTLDVLAGTVTIETENYFQNAAIKLADNTEVFLNESQAIRELSGTGTVAIAADKELTLNLSGDTSLDIVSSSGMYVVDPDSLDNFPEFAGKIVLNPAAAAGSSALFRIDGAGALLVSGQIGENVNIEIAGGQLIADIDSVSSRTITSTGTGEIIFFVAEGKDVDFSGVLKVDTTDNSDAKKTIGKVGAGTLSISGEKASDATLKVYQGTLRIDGTDAFNFANAVVAKDATLNLSYVGDEAKLSKIEGSGTIVLSYQSTIGAPKVVYLGAQNSMNPVSAAASGDPYFNGILSVVGLDVLVSAPNLKLCSIATDADSSFTINPETTGTTIYQSHNTVMAGTFKAEELLTITGAGRLSILDKDAAGLILVKDGSLQLDSSADLSGNGVDEGELRVENSANLYFSSENFSTSKNQIAQVEISTGGNDVGIGAISIIKTGSKDMTLTFENAVDAGREVLSVSTGLWDKTVGDGKLSTASLTFGVEEGELILSGLESLDSDVKLVTMSSSVTEGAVGTLTIFAEAGSEEKLPQSISGNGNFKKTGSGSLSVDSSQEYTGTTTIAAGAVSYAAGTTLATDSLVVSDGATLNGGVTLVGYKKVGEETVSGGNFILKDGGKLTLYVDAQNPVSYAGTLDVSGSVILTGGASNERGNEMVIFKSLNPNAIAFTEDELRKIGEKMTNNSSALMISQTSAGTISAYAIQESFSKLHNVDLRDGLVGSFTDVLDELCGSAQSGEIVLESELNRLGAIGAALNKSSAGTLAADIANLSPISFASMIAMPLSTFNSDISQISQRTAQRRYDGASVIRENGPEFFAVAQSDLVTNTHGTDAANYDFNTYGALAGIDYKLDEFTVVGFSLGADYGSANIHDGGGKIKMDNYRATLFTSGLLFDGTWFFDAGAQFGVANFDTKRNTLVGTNDGDTSSWSAGLFGTIGRGFILYASEDYQFHFTPYAGLSCLYSSVDSFNETGVSALDVDSFDATSLRARLGFGLHWLFPLGEWQARLSFDASFAHEFMDDEADIDASFRGTANSAFSVSANTLSSNVISAGPTLSIDLSDQTSLFFGYSVQYGADDEQFTQGFNVGFRRSF